MNDHPHLQGLLALAAAGVLDPAGEREVRRHVLECPGCAARLDELRAAGAALRGLPPAAPSTDLLLRTHRLLAAEIAAADRRAANVVLVAATLFGWTLPLLLWTTYRVATGAVPDLSGALAWLAISGTLCWLTGAVAVLMIGRNRHSRRTL